MDGILNIDKPPGLTSHDVVKKIRHIAGEARVGHTGTLDPLATGVLVCCLGKATRIAQYLEAGEKEYRAVMKLGVTTETLDADGRIVSVREYVPPDRSRILEVLAQFTGRILQRPPVFSAIKVRGIPSYKLARRGAGEALQERPVEVRAIELVSYDNPIITIAVRCSKGVYIRSLCSDIGEALGAGAHLTELIRTRSGLFHISDAMQLDELNGIPRDQIAARVLISPDRALADIHSVTVDAADSRKICHGNRVFADVQKREEDELVRVHSPSGELIALARIVQSELRPVTVFSPA